MKPIPIRSQGQLSYRSGVLVGLRMAVIVAKRFGERLTPEALEDALRIEAERIQKQQEEQQ